MPLSRRVLIAGFAALTLSACATQPAAPPSGAAPLTLVEAFKGRTRGEGVFKVPAAGIERRFTADLVGTVQGGRLTVRETFHFDDGEVQTLTWRFTRSGPGEWQGQRDDTVGVAQVRELGNEIRLSYVADVRSRDSVNRLGFADVIYRGANGRIINEAVVKKYDLPIGTVRFELQRR